MKRDRTGLRPCEQEIDGEGGLPGSAGQEEASSWSRTPDDILLNEELREVIDSAIHRLKPENRIVFVLRDQEGFSTREAAEMLDVSEGAVKTRLHRARAALARHLSHYFEEQRSGGR